MGACCRRTPVPSVWGPEFKEPVRPRFGFCRMAKVRCLGCTVEVLSLHWVCTWGGQHQQWAFCILVVV